MADYTLNNDSEEKKQPIEMLMEYLEKADTPENAAYFLTLHPELLSQDTNSVNR